MVKNPPARARDTRDLVQSLGLEDPLEEGMAAHSSILAWRIPWTEDWNSLYPGGLYSPCGRTESDMTERLSLHSLPGESRPF